MVPELNNVVGASDATALPTANNTATIPDLIVFISFLVFWLQLDLVP